jgi:hypothetical protein
MPRRALALGALPVAAGAALLATGYGSGWQPASAATGATHTMPAPGGGMMSAHTGALLTVGVPRPGAVVGANSIPTDVAISHFRVDCRFAGLADRPGVGHYHILLDRALVNMYCGPRASVSMQNVAPGRHMLEFVPAENSHADDFGAAKSVSFTYRPAHPLPALKAARFPGAPQIRILSPRAGASVHGSFLMRVAVSNFNLSCALYGKQPLPGWGHWHANIDTANAGMMGMGTMLGMSCGRSFRVSLAEIRPGLHRFFAILEDNQHAPTPHAMASVSVRVR